MTKRRWSLKYWDSPTARVKMKEISRDKFAVKIWDKLVDESDEEIFEFDSFMNAQEKAFDIMSAFLNEDEMRLLRQARHTAAENRIQAKIRNKWRK